MCKAPIIANHLFEGMLDQRVPPITISTTIGDVVSGSHPSIVVIGIAQCCRHSMWQLGTRKDHMFLLPGHRLMVESRLCPAEFAVHSLLVSKSYHGQTCVG